MPTFKPHISEYERKKDKKHRVSIEITQYGDQRYMDTGFYLVKKQITKDFRIKDNAVLRAVLDKIQQCEDILRDTVGGSLSSYSALQLKEYLEKRLNAVHSIDFIAFAREYIRDLLKEGERAKKLSGDRNKKEKRAKHIQSSVNAFVDKFGETYDICALKSTTLKEFEAYLRSEREITRRNQFGKEVRTKRKPLSDTGIHDYMTDLKVLFNKAEEKYNDRDNGIILIQNNPFAKYKIPVTSQPDSGKADLEAVRKIFGYDGHGLRAVLGRDLYKLSFFLVGINSVDLYEMKASALKDGRLTYNRSKTEGRRKDKATISIKAEPEALEIINRYIDPMQERLFSFYRMYTDSDSFNTAINKGLKQIREALDIKEDLTYYSARHAWASLAHNQLGYTEYDVAECLNHVIDGLKVTRGYIARDFSRIDKMNRAVIDWLLYC